MSLNYRHASTTVCVLVISLRLQKNKLVLLRLGNSSALKTRCSKLINKKSTKNVVRDNCVYFVQLLNSWLYL